MSRDEIRHATSDELALFVIDALEPGPRRWLERHVGACDACAQALAAEAAAESALVEAWSAVPRPLAPVLSLPVRTPAPVVAPARRAPVAVSTGWGDKFVAAALMLLFVGYWRAAGSGDPARLAGGGDSSGAYCALDDGGSCSLAGAPFARASLLVSNAPATGGMCAADAGGGLCREPVVVCTP